MPSKRLSQTTKLKGRAQDGFTCEQCGGEFLFSYQGGSITKTRSWNTPPEFCPICGRKIEQTPIEPNF
jgi:rubrerythrin